MEIKAFDVQPASNSLLTPAAGNHALKGAGHSKLGYEAAKAKPMGKTLCGG